MWRERTVRVHTHIEINNNNNNSINSSIIIIIIIIIIYKKRNFIESSEIVVDLCRR
jgi:hypothetical protein